MIYRGKKNEPHFTRWQVCRTHRLIRKIWDGNSAFVAVRSPIHTYLQHIVAKPNLCSSMTPKIVMHQAVKGQVSRLFRSCDVQSDKSNEIYMWHVLVCWGLFLLCFCEAKGTGYQTVPSGYLCGTISASQTCWKLQQVFTCVILDDEECQIMEKLAKAPYPEWFVHKSVDDRIGKAVGHCQPMAGVKAGVIYQFWTVIRDPVVEARDEVMEKCEGVKWQPW